KEIQHDLASQVLDRLRAPRPGAQTQLPPNDAVDDRSRILDEAFDAALRLHVAARPNEGKEGRVEVPRCRALHRKSGSALTCSTSCPLASRAGGPEVCSRLRTLSAGNICPAPASTVDGAPGRWERKAKERSRPKDR